MSRPASASVLDRERTRLVPVSAWVIAATTTGLALAIVRAHSTWIQWTLLVHLGAGFGFAIVVAPYVWIHLRRTLGIRRASVLFSGLTTLAPLVALFATGVHLAFVGHLESRPEVLQVHLWSAILLVATTTLHLLLHATTPRPGQTAGGERRFKSASREVALAAAIGAATPWILIAIASAAYDAQRGVPDGQPAIQPYAYDYGDHPFRPSQTETTTGRFVSADRIGRSERCGGCHPAIFEQWRASVHREAASDPTYVRNVDLLAEKKGIAATRYCEGCHAPVALLAGQLTPGGEHGGVAGTPANLEGVSCLTCHATDAVVHLKGVASYRFAPTSEYLFAQTESPLLRRVHDLVLRSRPGVHVREMGRGVLRDARSCATCHAQFMDADVNDWGWVQMQDDYAAWLDSPFSGHHEDGFSNTEAMRCQDCHMPLVEAGDPSADDEGRVRSHFFPGANTVLPALRGDQDQLDSTIEFLQANRLRVSIDPPNRADAQQTLRPVDEGLRGFEEAPYYFYLGERAELRITVSNHGVGHDFPGGTIDLGEAWLEVLALDAEGRVAYASGEIDGEDRVDPEAYFYRSLPIDRRGTLVWRHDLFNMVGESFKRVVKAGQSDLVEYGFEVPAWAKSPLTVSVRLRYRKLNERYAKWALGKLYQPVMAVDMARDALRVPVRVRREVE